MIREAVEKSKGLDIVYKVKSAEELDYFDVIFCNSAFQWFKDPEKAIKNCYRALRRDGRIGIQAPARKIYCPNFIRAIEMVKRDERTKDVLEYIEFLLERKGKKRGQLSLTWKGVLRILKVNTPLWFGT